MSTLLEQASLVMIPSGYAEDIVYSVIPQSGAGDLSFTRASNGTRVNSAGLVEVCPWNLLQYSEQFDNAAWIKFNASITPNDATAPNGTLTADKVVFSGASHYFYQQISFVGQATASIYIKGTAGQTISIDNTQTITEPLITLTGEWQRIVLTSTTTGASVQGLAISTYQSATARTIYVWGGQINIGSTAKPYFPTTDRLNVPRLTYQNGGGGCPSLLLEKQSTNLITYSEQLDNASWSKIDNGAATTPVVTANYTTSPDGTQNADRVQFARTGTADSVYSLLISNTCNTSATSTYTMYVKSLTSSTQNLLVYWGGGGGSVFQVTTEWTRITLSNLPSASQQMVIGTRGGAGNYYNGGDLSLDVAIWGCQLEQSSYPTSYIPTTSSSATRVADACFKTGISSLIGQTEGVLFADVTLTTRQSFSYISISNAGSSSNYVGIYFRAAAIELEVVNGAVLQGNVIYSNTSTGRFKVAIGYKANDFVLYVNGTQIGTDTSGTIPTCNYLDLFGFGDAQPFQNNQTALFKTRLTNSELAQLTGNQNYTINQAYASYGVASESPNCVQP